MDNNVSYKVAKLARKKGFDEKCYYSYASDETLMMPWHCDCDDLTKEKFGVTNTDLLNNKTKLQSLEDWATAPKQAHLQKWLRERGIHVIVKLNTYTMIYDVFIESKGEKHSSLFYQSYEEALDKGLELALIRFL